jgi:hypothetical protein
LLSEFKLFVPFAKFLLFILLVFAPEVTTFFLITLLLSKEALTLHICSFDADLTGDANFVGEFKLFEVLCVACWLLNFGILIVFNAFPFKLFDSPNDFMAEFIEFTIVPFILLLFATLVPITFLLTPLFALLDVFVVITCLTVIDGFVCVCFFMPFLVGDEFAFVLLNSLFAVAGCVLLAVLMVWVGLSAPFVPFTSLLGLVVPLLVFIMFMLSFVGVLVPDWVDAASSPLGLL